MGVPWPWRGHEAPCAMVSIPTVLMGLQGPTCPQSLDMSPSLEGT